MELTISPRAREQKKEAKRLRRAGMIPAVLYQRGSESQKIGIPAAEFGAHLRQLPAGGLATAVFTLKGESGPVRAIVKDIQYHRTSYDILHLDFLELKDDVPVTVRVPIRLRGKVDCVGVKLGGVLRPVIRAVPVRCLPGSIPTDLSIDVRTMAIGHTRRLSDIALPDGLRMLARVEEVAVVVAKR